MLEIKITLTAAPELLNALLAFRASPQPVQPVHPYLPVAQVEAVPPATPKPRGRPPRATPVEPSLPDAGPTLPGDTEELKAACRIIIEGIMSKDMEVQTQNPGTEYRVGREKVKAVLTDLAPSGKLKDVPVERLAEALEALKAL